MTNNSIHALVRDIEIVEKERPLKNQGDVVVLKKLYEATEQIPRVIRWFILIIAWCLREPVLIEMFSERVHAVSLRQHQDELNCRNIRQFVHYLTDIKLPKKGRFLPPRCRTFLNPSAILQMDFPSLFRTAVAAAICFGAPTTYIIKRQYEEIIVRRIRLIHGVGNYSASHFLRSAS